MMPNSRKAVDKGMVLCSYDHKEIDCEELLELFLRAGLDLSRHMPPGDAVIQDKSVGKHVQLPHHSVPSCGHHYMSY